MSLPFSDYCDPIVQTSDQWSILASHLLADECQVKVRCLHNTLPVEDARFSVAGKAKWHGLSLEPDLEALWQGLDSGARRAVRKAQTAGVTVDVAETDDELRAFYSMHLGVRKHKYRLLAQPYEFFRNIWRNLLQPGKGFLLLARVDRQIVGGVLFLEWKDGLYYKFNASLPGHLASRPNDLLLWEGIKSREGEGPQLPGLRPQRLGSARVGTLQAEVRT